jgi:hypothetical protein
MKARLRTLASNFCINNTRRSSTSENNYNLWSKYLTLLKERPILTKCVTSGLLSCGADVVCQLQFADKTVDKKDTDLDAWRVLKFSGIGAFFVGPVLHYWYGFLASRFIGASLFTTVQRVALDQLFFAPLFIPAFFSIILILDGKPELIVDKLQSDWASTMITNYSVWIPAMFLNFKFVPPTLQVLFSNGVGFGWNIYLSYMSYKVDETAEVGTEIVNTIGSQSVEK